MVRTALVILNWNSSSDVQELLSGWDDGLLSHAIVVDNGSDDGERERDNILPSLGSGHYVTLPRNGGYAHGMNAGVRKAMELGYAAVILVNADARPERPALKSLETALDRFDIVGIKQSSSFDLTGAYSSAGRRRGLVFKDFTCSGDCEPGIHSVDLVSGALIAIRCGSWSELGGIEESYFHYKEEVEFCYRASVRGYRMGWLCRPVVYHKRGGSLGTESSGATYYRARNEILYFRRNAKTDSVAPGILNWRLWATEARHFRRAAEGRVVGSFVSGVIDGLKGVSGRDWRGSSA